MTEIRFADRRARYSWVMSDAVESELKIPVDDLAAVRVRLREAAAARLEPSTREHNVLYDTAEHHLAASHCALRLRRRGGHAWLTFKGPPSFAGGIKSRAELETEVSDPAAADALLRRLGHEPVVRYEKDRETWCLTGVTIELDLTPLGAFVELEGPVAALAATATRIGLDPSQSLAASYLALWCRHRAEHPELGLGIDMVWP